MKTNSTSIPSRRPSSAVQAQTRRAATMAFRFPEPPPSVPSSANLAGLPHWTSPAPSPAVAAPVVVPPRFPFPSVDFPGRATLTVAEVAAKLGWTEKHIADLVSEGELPGVDGKGPEARRGSYRIPVESYRDFIAGRITGRRRVEMLLALPKDTLVELVRELTAYLGGTPSGPCNDLPPFDPNPTHPAASEAPGGFPFQP